MAEYVYSNVDENRFWLQVMAENALLIRNRLSPEKKSEISQADLLAQRFDSLYDRAVQIQNTGQLAQINMDALASTKDLRSYILTIISKQLTEGLYVYYKPVFLNNLVSLTDKYLYVLGQHMQNRQPQFVPIVQDIFWLPVFYTESRLIADSLGEFQGTLRQKADSFTSNFTLYFQTALGLQGILRTDLTDFPIMNQYRAEIRELLNQFAEYVVDLINLTREQKIPGTITLLDLDFIYRKLCYYTTQLSVIAKLQKPACDPGAPRMELNIKQTGMQ